MTERLVDDVFLEVVHEFVNALNSRARARIEAGHPPLYREFGFTMGRTRARVFSFDSNRPDGGKQSHVFVCRDGLVRRSDSWEKSGRILGRPSDHKVLEYVGGPA